MTGHVLGVAGLGGYERRWLRGDVLAGVSVTAYLIPQVMAYAELAGLPAAAGLWAAIGAMVGYAFLGSSKQLSVGPESTTALMTAAGLASLTGVDADRGSLAVWLAVTVAAVCLLGWLLKLDRLADLLSRPVLVGYMSGIAFVMIASQLGKLLGVTVDTESFSGYLTGVAGRLDDVNVSTVWVGLITLIMLFAGSALFPRAPVVLLGLLGATAAVALLDLKASGVRTVGSIDAAPIVPGSGLAALPFDQWSLLLLPALGIAFVGYSDNILTARAFAARHHERIDARRELLGLAGANLGSAAVHGFPVSSSGSRTAIADASGGRTQIAALVTVVCTAASLLVLGPVLAATPVAGLAAVVIYAAVRLIDVGEFVRFARFRTSELVLALVTLLAVLAVGVLKGVVIAIALSVLDLLRRVARPHDAVEGFVPGLAGMHDVEDYPDAGVVPGLVVYRYDSPLFFANAEDFGHRAIVALETSVEPVEWFVLNTEAIVEVDITAVDALHTLADELTSRGIVFGLARVKQDLRVELEPSGLLERVGADHVFATLPTAVAAFEARSRPTRSDPPLTENGGVDD